MRLHLDFELEICCFRDMNRRGGRRLISSGRSGRGGRGRGVVRIERPAQERPLYLGFDMEAIFDMERQGQEEMMRARDDVFDLTRLIVADHNRSEVERINARNSCERACRRIAAGRFLMSQVATDTRRCWLQYAERHRLLSADSAARLLESEATIGFEGQQRYFNREVLPRDVVNDFGVPGGLEIAPGDLVQELMEEPEPLVPVGRRPGGAFPGVGAEEVEDVVQGVGPEPPVLNVPEGQRGAPLLIGVAGNDLDAQVLADLLVDDAILPDL